MIYIILKFAEKLRLVKTTYQYVQYLETSDIKLPDSSVTCPSLPGNKQMTLSYLIGVLLILPYLGINEVIPLVTRQDIVNQDSRPFSILAQPDLIGSFWTDLLGNQYLLHKFRTFSKHR